MGQNYGSSWKMWRFRTTQHETELKDGIRLGIQTDIQENQSQRAGIVPLLSQTVNSSHSITLAQFFFSALKRLQIQSGVEEQKNLLYPIPAEATGQPNNWLRSRFSDLQLLLGGSAFLQQTISCDRAEPAAAASSAAKPVPA
ncbi:hypothetical protein CRENBAI_016072 [Crenichthys baileyi]|uniref:Uncharacterized protein n=1 Tax=Crenichthys baileyi TaxID=28760 RepID=A0AAV9RJC5_9TELE